LGNWQPITLLGSLYKILAKILAGRIQGVLPHIIRPYQTGFVEGRSILDNVYLAQEALVWAEEDN
jgi:mannosylglycoprotein endo-beta-mannosidase